MVARAPRSRSGPPAATGEKSNSINGPADRASIFFDRAGDPASRVVDVAVSRPHGKLGDSAAPNHAVRGEGSVFEADPTSSAHHAQPMKFSR